ncbi:MULTISPECIES: hypothetical protein [Exiguobacterium]|uniref:hypothetical protein n=1 Tax=Exiguobacterium TaxID=33986 RepID=UPI001BE94EC4|nr:MULTISPECIES: hypothetical protein [Exiguobacterium]MCT4782630.1 hypothetical protein [Exiguobacterium himgiriensis]
MNRLRIDPATYDAWSALPVYFQEQSPFYVEGDVSTPTAFIELIGHGIVAEADVLLVETTSRPDDRYWLEPSAPNGVYSLVDLLALDFHHPLLYVGAYDETTDYVTLKRLWDEGYRVPSKRWSRETYEAHLARERQVEHRLSPTTVCAICTSDLSNRYGPLAVRLMECHMEAEAEMWVCPTCHKALHCK